jgi:hypothetical protein
MQKIILTFGFIAGGLMAAMMLLTVPFTDHGEGSMVVGYATMILAFMLVFVGIKRYRDTVGGGRVTFGRAFLVGITISLIASACYVATWEVVYHNFFPDFIDKYAASSIEKARAAGTPEAQIAKDSAEMAVMAVRYKNNLLYNIALTFAEPLPVGILMTLIAAGVLKRKEPMLA